MKQHIVAGLFLFSIFAVPAEAATVMRSGPAVSVANDQVVAANFYAWGNTVTVSGDMGGDVVVAGGTVTINGIVAGDVLVAGGTVTISGDVADDVRILGGEVIIEGAISGNVSVFGGRLKLLSNATVAGDVVIYANDAMLEGVIGGQVLGSINKLRINGAVAGVVDVTTTNLVLGDRAKLQSTMTYVSQNDFIRATNASVEGEILRNDPPIQTTRQDTYRLTAMIFLMILFGTLTCYLVFRRRVTHFAEVVTEGQFWKAALLGFACLVTVPFVVVILMASMLGVLVAVLILLMFILLLIGTILLLPVTIGALLSTIFKRHMSESFVLWILAGTMVLVALMIIPFIGPILLVTCILITFGTLITLIVRWLAIESTTLEA